MQIANRIGEKYQLINGDVVTYNELCQDEKVRLYQQEHGCDLETATVAILTQEEEHEGEQKRKEYSNQDDMVEDDNGDFVKLEGIELDGEIRQFMKDNPDCNYASAYEAIAKNKTEEGEGSRYSGEIDGDTLILKDNDNGRTVRFSKDAIEIYRQKHDCSYDRAEREIYSKAINRLQEVC